MTSAAGLLEAFDVAARRLAVAMSPPGSVQDPLSEAALEQALAEMHVLALVDGPGAFEGACSSDREDTAGRGGREAERGKA